MNLYDLFETDITSTLSKSFKEFLEKYKDNRNGNLYVLFTNNDGVYFEKSGKGPLPNAMVVYPLEYVVSNIREFSRKTEKNIYVVTLRGNGVDISKLPIEKVEDIKKNVKPSLVKQLFGDADTKIGYIFNGGAPSFALNPKDYKAVYVLKSHLLRVEDVFKFVTSSSSITRIEQIKKTTRKLASLIAKELDTELSKDIEVEVLMKSVFWTNDGIEITITKFIDYSSSSNDNDGTYYFIICDTPNGIVTHNSSPTDTHESIAKVVGNVYRKLNRHVDDWSFKSRDIYLHGKQFFSKSLDEDSMRIRRTVEEYYPKIRLFGIRLGITLPHLKSFTDIDVIMIYYIVENFISKNDDIGTYLEDNEINDLSDIVDVSLGISKNINIGFVKDLILVYRGAKNLTPQRNSWDIFRHLV